MVGVVGRIGVKRGALESSYSMSLSDSVGDFPRFWELSGADAASDSARVGRTRGNCPWPSMVL